MKSKMTPKKGAKKGQLVFYDPETKEEMKHCEITKYAEDNKLVESQPNIHLILLSDSRLKVVRSFLRKGK